MQKNADDSVDVCFGPQAPAGKESSWAPTPIEKEWKLTDVERID